MGALHQNLSSLAAPSVIINLLYSLIHSRGRHCRSALLLDRIFSPHSNATGLLYFSIFCSLGSCFRHSHSYCDGHARE